MSKRVRINLINLSLVVLLVIGVLLLFNQQEEQEQVQHGHVQSAYNLIEPIDEELVRQLELELPEIDYGFWYSYAKPQNYSLSSKCAKYPNPIDLQLHNTYWQTFVNGNVTFRLYAAYLDMRLGVTSSSSSKGIVRILATANQNGYAFPVTQCQLWYENYKQPIIVQISQFLNVWPMIWGQFKRVNYPHLLSCPLPEDLPSNLTRFTPRTVSLVGQSCDYAANSLRVNYAESPAFSSSSNPASSSSSHHASSSSSHHGSSSHHASSSSFNHASSSSLSSTSKPKLSIGVCLKAFDFPYVDMSQRLVEWFELQRVLGSSKIYAYVYDVHPNMQRVLDYYQRSGYLELRPLTMANGMPRLRHYQHLLLQERLVVKRLNELIPYNDCFYRHMQRHDYLLNVDIDEVIMPLGQLRSWQEMLESVDDMTHLNCPNGHYALCLLNVHFTKVLLPKQLDLPDDLYVLQHTLRLRNHSRPHRATKCFHNTRYSVTLHNHFTLEYLPGSCNMLSLNTTLAQMQHYREPPRVYNMTELVEDRSVWKFATELRAAVRHVWLQLDDVQSNVSNINSNIF